MGKTETKTEGKKLSWGRAYGAMVQGKRITKESWGNKEVFLFLDTPKFSIEGIPAKSVYIKSSNGKISPFELNSKLAAANDYIVL